MTIYYPDISSFQGAISLKGTVAVCAKVTEGTGWADPQFAGAVGRAHAAGAWPFAYHFLHAGNPAGQAGWCHAHAAGLPLMLDFEPSGASKPGMPDATGFIDTFRQLGGVCNLVYLPRWYWQQIGSPALGAFTQRKMGLVSSAYTSYSDSGSGWAGYGGMTPSIWQYTDHQPFNGQQVDFNAFKGTVAQLQALVAGAGPVPDPYPTLRQGDTGAAVSVAQGRLNTHGATPPVTADGAFGPATATAVTAFQGRCGLAADGVIGPATWTKLNTSPTPPAPANPAGAAVPYHGQWVASGNLSLADLASSLGYPSGMLLRMTSVHYGALGPALSAYVTGVLTGTVLPSAHLPAGATFWCD